MGCVCLGFTKSCLSTVAVEMLSRFLSTCQSGCSASRLSWVHPAVIVNIPIMVDLIAPKRLLSKYGSTQREAKTLHSAHTLLDFCNCCMQISTG